MNHIFKYILPLTLKDFILHRITNHRNLLTIIICFTQIICIKHSKNLYAQKDDLKFEHITADQGLSQNCVMFIFQDSKGFMWFGTQDELNKYDGYRITIYNHDPLDKNSLSGNSTHSIYEDNFNNLWIDTNNGISKFNIEKEEFTNYTSIHATSFHEDSAGALWAITPNLEFYIYDYEKGKFTIYIHDSTNFVKLNNRLLQIIYKDKTNSYWFGTNGGGLARFNLNDIGKGDFKLYKHDPLNKKSLSHNIIWTIFEDRSGKLWIGTEGGGINRFKKETEEFIHYKHDTLDSTSLSEDYVQSIYEDQTGTLWVGTNGGGLNKFDQEKEEFACYKHNQSDQNSLSSNNVWSIFQDRIGILWIGTKDGGVNKCSTEKIKFNHYKHDPANPNSLKNNTVWSIYEDNSGTLWIGTQNGLSKLNREDRNKEKFINYEHDPTNPQSLGNFPVRAICEDRFGFLWIATLGDGLYKYYKKEEKFYHYKHDLTNHNSLISDDLYALYEDLTGTLWIGANNGGISKFDREKNEFIHYEKHLKELVNNYNYYPWVTTIYEDNSGTLWLGTWLGGLIQFDKEKVEFTQYKSDPGNPNSISTSTIFSIYEDMNGILWIGTYGGGLNKFDRETGKFNYFTKKNGLANNVIYGILEDTYGNLWLSTNRGLSRFNPQTKTFRNYDIDDGLQGNEFNLGAYYKSKNGEMFFGGYNGLNSFYPENIINSYPPIVVLTSFKKFGKEVELDKPISKINELKLSYKEDFFSFEFAALHYKNPPKNQYAYMMEGFNKDWIYIGTTREANFTNLEPGKYTFRVKAANCDGVWNEEGISVKIVINPPFWSTWWFYILSTVFAGLTIVIIHNIRVNQALRIERLKYNEREQIRRRLAADFHDELGHRVTKISLTCKMLGKELSSASSKIKDSLKKINDNADSLFKEMKEYIWTLDPEKDSVYDIAVQLKNFSDQLFDRTDIAFQLIGLSNDLENVKLSMDWRKHLLRIFKEGMHNILKHADGCENVTLEIKLNDNILEIILTDDGRGFDVDNCSSGNGLENMHERAKQIGGKLQIISKSGSGTKIHFIGKLP